jgi:hypothetical protein
MGKSFCTKMVCFLAMTGLVAFACVVLTGTLATTIAAQGKLDAAKIEQLTGTKGEMNEKEGVFTVRAR